MKTEGTLVQFKNFDCGNYLCLFVPICVPSIKSVLLTSPEILLVPQRDNQAGTPNPERRLTGRIDKLWPRQTFAPLCTICAPGSNLCFLPVLSSCWRPSVLINLERQMQKGGSAIEFINSDHAKHLRLLVPICAPSIKFVPITSSKILMAVHMRIFCSEWTSSFSFWHMLNDEKYSLSFY